MSAVPDPAPPPTTPAADAGTAANDDAVANPLGLREEASKRAYAWLLDQSKDPIGILSADGVRRHPLLTTDKCSQSCPEKNYDKPEGFVVISRSFLPGLKRDMRDAAVRVLPLTATDAHIRDMVSLMTEMWTVIGKQLSGKVFLVLSEECRRLKIRIGNRFATSLHDVGTAFKKEEPSVAAMKKYFELFYETLEKGNTKNEIVNQVMYDHRLWFSNKAADRNTVGNGKVKSSCIQHMLMDKYREKRNPYKKQGRNPHGITFSTTVKGGRQANDMPRRKKDEGFDPTISLDGWGGAKHLEFCADNGFSVPKKVCSVVTCFDL